MTRFWRRRNRSHGSARLNHAGTNGYHRSAIRCVAMLSCAVLVSAPALAGESAFGGGYILSRESNPTGTSTGARQDTSNAVFAGIAYGEHTIDLNARFLAQVEKRAFLTNDNLDDTHIYLDGTGVWTISPQLLFWTAEASRRDARVDITRVDSPTNRTQVSSLHTGPDVNFRFGSTDSSAVGARLGRLDSDATGTTDSLSAYARLLHRMSEQSTLSLNYEALRAEFAGGSTFRPSSTRADLFARFETRPLPNSFALDIGSTTVTREGAESLSGRLVQVTAARQFTPESALRATYTSQYSDTFTDMLRAISRPTIPGDAVLLPGVDVLTADFYYNKRGELLYSDDNGRFVYALRASARNVDYQTLNLDFKEQGGRIDWLWRYSGFTHLYAMARYLKREFQDFYQKDVDRETILGVRLNVNQNISISLEGGRMTHESTAPPGDISNSRVMLLLGYSTGPLYTARSRR